MSGSQVTLRLERISAEQHRGRHPGPLERGAYDQRHYLATLTYQGRSARFRFTTGPAWRRRPVAREVLKSVLSDVAILEYADTAAELEREGLAEEGDGARLLAALKAEDRKVRRLLGDDHDAAIQDPSGWAWRVTDDPPEGLGEPLRPGTLRYAGRVGVHRDGYPVRVTIELRARNGKPAELSVCGSTPYSGGQCREELDGLETFAAPWDAARVARLGEVWDAWHLNGMRAGCEHQRADGLASGTCETCGYAYGSAWLAEPLPADVLEWLAQLPGFEDAADLAQGVPV